MIGYFLTRGTCKPACIPFFKFAFVCEVGMHVCISMHPILFTTNRVNEGITNLIYVRNYVMCYGAYNNIIYLLTYDSSITITLKLHQFLIVEHRLFCYFCI